MKKSNTAALDPRNDNEVPCYYPSAGESAADCAKVLGGTLARRIGASTLLAQIVERDTGLSWWVVS